MKSFFTRWRNKRHPKIVNNTSITDSIENKWMVISTIGMAIATFFMATMSCWNNYIFTKDFNITHRPYLTLENLRINSTNKTIVLIVKNVGNIPAQNVKSYVELYGNNTIRINSPAKYVIFPERSDTFFGGWGNILPKKLSINIKVEYTDSKNEQYSTENWESYDYDIDKNTSVLDSVKVR